MYVFLHGVFFLRVYVYVHIAAHIYLHAYTFCLVFISVFLVECLALPVYVLPYLVVEMNENI